MSAVKSLSEVSAGSIEDVLGCGTVCWFSFSPVLKLERASICSPSRSLVLAKASPEESGGLLSSTRSEKTGLSGKLSENSCAESASSSAFLACCAALLAVF